MKKHLLLSLSLGLLLHSSTSAQESNESLINWVNRLSENMRYNTSFITISSDEGTIFEATHPKVSHSDSTITFRNEAARVFSINLGELEHYDQEPDITYLNDDIFGNGSFHTCYVRYNFQFKNNYPKSIRFSIAFIYSKESDGSMTIPGLNRFNTLLYEFDNAQMGSFVDDDSYKITQQDADGYFYNNNTVHLQLKDPSQKSLDENIQDVVSNSTKLGSLIKDTYKGGDRRNWALISGGVGYSASPFINGAFDAISKIGFAGQITFLNYHRFSFGVSVRTFNLKDGLDDSPQQIKYNHVSIGASIGFDVTLDPDPKQRHHHLYPHVGFGYGFGSAHYSIKQDSSQNYTQCFPVSPGLDYYLCFNQIFGLGLFADYSFILGKPEGMSYTLHDFPSIGAVLGITF